MSSTIALQELFKAGFDDFVVPSYETAPFTTIQNRAQVTRSLKAIAGVERVHVKGLNRLPNEFGPGGQPVFEADNKDARIRFIGPSWTNSSTTHGSIVFTNSTSEYLEITFYGTGLNLMFAPVAAGDIRISIDGGTEGSNILAAMSSILNNRNYCSNTVVNATSALSLGWHTIKVRANSVVTMNLNFAGFEVLNQRTDLAVYSGAGISNGSFNGLSSLATSAFNDGVTGTRGARIVKYIENGTLKSAVQEVDSASKYVSLADHTNEEIVRRINWREFGANRADDFSTYSTGLSDRAFTLDDGTTTLVVDNALTTTNGAITPDNTASSMTLTFVGTGIDLDVESMGAGTTTFSIDGASVGSVTTSFSTRRIVKIASGLSYGTHTVKIVTSTGSPYFPIHDFIIYQPKKPSVPVGALEVADYNLMATYSVNTIAGIDTIATGILRKQNTREFVYTGTFSALFDVAGSISGFNVNSATAGNKIIYSFFGTGLEIRPGGSAANTFTVSVNGSTNLSSLTTSVYGANIALTAATGTVVQSVAAQSGQGIAIRGLSLGFHTVELTKVSGAGGMSATFDIITPVHISDSTLKVGSQSLKSIVKYSPEKAQSNTGPDLSTAKAWIVFDGSGQEIQKSYNISAILKNTTGQYTVFFEKPFKNDYYTCSYQGSTSQSFISAAGAPGTGNSGGKRRESFTFTTTGTTGSIADAGSNSSVVFFGELIDE